MITTKYCDTKQLAVESSATALSERNDCVVRAFMAGFDITYDEAHAWVAQKYNRKPLQGVVHMRYQSYSIVNEEYFGKRLTFHGKGFSKKWMVVDRELSLVESKTEHNTLQAEVLLVDPKTPTNRMSRKLFTKTFNKGTYIVAVRGHALCIKDGIVYDNANADRVNCNAVVEFSSKIS